MTAPRVGRYNPSREKLSARRWQRLAFAALKFVDADQKVQRVRREFPRGAPERSYAFAARRAAKDSIQYHAAELRKVEPWR